jgi:acetate kinase
MIAAPNKERAMRDSLLLSFNCGSSTIKTGLYRIESGKPRALAGGAIDFRKSPFRFKMSGGKATFDVPLEAKSPDDLESIARQSFDALGGHFDLSKLLAAGHRVVHGGDRFKCPCLLDDDAAEAIANLAVLAPLHQGQALALIRAVRKLRPQLPQAACFDTTFHQCQPELVRRFALPRSMFDRGIKRYGFHGLSYQYIAGELARRDPNLAKGKVIVLHLGSGASLCGMENGKSVDTSMGFSALDGVPMATRCGALDPGVVLHLQGPETMSAKEIEDLLYHRSGLLGISGISADTRDLMASHAPEARQALEIFAFRTAGEIARLAATLEGLDTIVFTAGIGENQPEIREAICARLGWLGVALDTGANAKNSYSIGSAKSRIHVLVIPTDEQQVIAEETLALVGKR